MSKRVVIVHGYKGKPETNWKPWLKRELEKKGFEVDVPAMPHTKHPVAAEWVAKLADIVDEPNLDTYLVGHSLGCITILRYLETLAEGQKIGGAILVAGFGERFQKYQAGNHDTFFDHELDWARIRSHCNNFVAIHSDDDSGVDVSQLDLFADKLGAKPLLEHGFGHFSSADGVFEIPLVRNELLAMVEH
ncbi:MAG TPA: alpha/beta fold hydrolase [Candidatus Saccharimonadales bacterium]|nr:alpha/beta fold hydrolase [Candidatus Saccharimonadales bacterium]